MREMREAIRDLAHTALNGYSRVSTESQDVYQLGLRDNHLGTGKSFLLSLLVMAALKAAQERRGAVVICTRSRRLQEAILQAPDFFRTHFREPDYCSPASRLGRPADGTGGAYSETSIRKHES